MLTSNQSSRHRKCISEIVDEISTKCWNCLAYLATLISDFIGITYLTHVLLKRAFTDHC